jgi:hypothetical protein
MLLLLVLVMVVLTALAYGVIFVRYTPEEPLKLGLAPDITDPTPTATSPADEVPTYPPTWTPAPTDTPAPTGTPTETLTPTSTSTPTNTPTPVPSRTPTETNTPLPTSTSTRAPTPTPLPWSVSDTSTENSCDVVRVYIRAVDSSGVGVEGIQFEVGELNVAGSRFTVTTNANGLTAWDNSPGNARTWFVAPLDASGQRAGQLVTWQSDDEDVCDITSAIQIYNITWRRSN